MKNNKFIKHFCLLESGHDSGSHMIGVIMDVTNDKNGLTSFEQRATKAIERHFDSELTQGKKSLYHTPEFIFAGSPYHDVEINTIGDGEDDYLHKIKILETWTY